MSSDNILVLTTPPPQARMFSTSASAQAKLVKAPIQLFGVEGRYAHALYSAASKQKQLDSVEKELTKVKVWHHF